jgi:hypothetical protein
MFFLMVKTIGISLLLIALIHYLYGFFKNTLTVPKVKDLVNKPAKRYNEMFAVLNNEQNYQQNMEQKQSMDEQEQQQSMGQQSMGQQSMQAELNNFLNELKKPGANMMGANMMGANMMGANMMGANIMGANIMGANIMDKHITDKNMMDNSFPAANESAFGSYTQF